MWTAGESAEERRKKTWPNFKVGPLTLSLQGTEAAQCWIRGGCMHKNKQTMRTLSMNYLVKWCVLWTELGTNKMKLEGTSAMNNFNSKLHFFDEATFHKLDFFLGRHQKCLTHLHIKAHKRLSEVALFQFS